MNLPRRVTFIVALLASSGALAQAVVPDPTLTPGSVRTTDVHEICANGTSPERAEAIPQCC